MGKGNLRNNNGPPTNSPLSLKAIVFDLDDTLYSQKDFKESGLAATASWLAEQHRYSFEQTRRTFQKILADKGPSHPYIFNDFVAELKLSEQLIPQMVAVFRNHSPKISCFPGVNSMLARLKKNYLLGILTDGILPVQQNKIKALDLESKVDVCLCSASLQLEKPAPELFAWFEQRFDLQGRQLVYVADNPTKDFIGARKRAWRTVRVLTGEHAEMVAKPGYDADTTINRMTDLESLIAVRRGIVSAS